MSRIIVLFVLCFASISCAQEIGIAPEEFLAACRQGFQADYGSDPAATELGWGECQVLFSNREVVNSLSYEEYEALPRQTPEKVAADLPNTPVARTVTASWYAWTDGKVLNVVYNCVWGNAEKELVHGCATGNEEADRWGASSNCHFYGKGDRFWYQANRPCVTKIWLGAPGQNVKETLRLRLEQLKKLRVIK